MIKEEPVVNNDAQEEENDIEDNEEKETNKSKMPIIQMPLIWFIVLQLGIIAFEILIGCVVCKYFGKNKKSKHGKTK